MKTPQQFLNDCMTAYLAYARSCGFAANAVDRTQVLFLAAKRIGLKLLQEANLQKAANDPVSFNRKVISAIGSCVYAGIVYGCKYRKDPALIEDASLDVKIVEEGPMDMARDTLKRYFGFEQGEERAFITGLTDKWNEVCGEYLGLDFNARQPYIVASMISAFQLGTTMAMDKLKIPDGSTFIFGDEPKESKTATAKPPVIPPQKPQEKDPPVRKPTPEVKKPEPPPVAEPQTKPVVTPPVAQAQDAVPTAAIQDIQVDAVCCKYLSLANVMSSIPLISQVRVINKGSLIEAGLICRISCEGNYFAVRTVDVPVVAPQSEVLVGNYSGSVSLHFSKKLISEVVEVRDTHVKIEVIKNGNAVAVKEYRLWVFAKDIFVWDNDSRLFAAFATRNAMTIAHLHSHIAAEMKRLTGDPSIHSYQGGDQNVIRKHCLKLCEAIYNAVQAHGINYDEPKDVEGICGQKIRLADDVFIEREATCLDSALLFAAIMESCGLNPVLIVKTGHAFVGCHLLNEHFTRDVLGGDSKRAEADIGEMKRLVGASRNELVGRFIAIETTCVGMPNDDGTGKISFDDAVRRGREEIEDLRTEDEDSTDHFRCAVDMRLARRNVPAIESSRKFTLDTCPVKPIAEYAQVRVKGGLDIETFGTGGRGGVGGPMPQRVKDWASSLMQLTSKNPLLSRAQSKCLINVECTGERNVGEFVDRLSSSSSGYTFANRKQIGDLYATDYDRQQAAQNGGVLPVETLTRLVPVAFDNGRLCISDQQEKPGKARRWKSSKKGVALSKRHRRQAYVADLQKLADLARVSAEETGVETLYASVGCIEWESEETKGRVEKCRAPILLLPVELEISSGTDGCKLKRRGGSSEAFLNEPLLKFLEARDIVFDDFAGGLPMKDSGVDALRVLKTLDDRIFNRGDLKVVFDVCIGHFTFGSYAKWADIHGYYERFEDHPVLKQLIDAKGHYNDGIEKVTTANLHQYLKPEEMYCPRPMDSTQLAAVLNSANGKSFILNGPPGTGKSHTITNIIAHNLAMGKRILFVAQKETALSVVKRGLNEAGLAPFCLLLDAEGGLASIFEQFRQSIEIGASSDSERWRRLALQLAEMRRPLEEYVKALHAPMIGGRTPYQILQKYFERGRSEYADWIDAVCCAETDAEIEPRRTALGNFANYHAEVRDKLSLIEGLPQLKIEHVSISARTKLARACEHIQTTAAALTDKLRTLDDHWNVRYDPDAAFLSGLKTLIEVLLRLGCQLEITPDSYYSQAESELEKCIAAAAQCSDDSVDLEARFAAAREKVEKWCDVMRIADLDADARRAEIERWRSKRVHMMWDKNPIKSLNVYRSDGKTFANDGEEAVEFLSAVSAYGKLKSARDAGGLEACGHVNALSDSCRTPMANCRDAIAVYEAAMDELSQFIVDEGVLKGSVSEVLKLAECLLENQAWIHCAIEYRDLKAKAVSLKIGGFVELVQNGKLGPSEAVKAFDHALATRQLDLMFEDPAFGSIDAFDVDQRNKEIEAYRKNLQTYQDLSASATFAKIAAAYPNFKTGEGLPEDQNRMLGTIKNYIREPSNCKSVRQFLHDVSPLLERIKPCLLMTPTAVAQLIPMDVKPFDLVIFDEASQLETCDTIGVIARGKQVIVTGDPMQMPPSKEVGVSNKTLGMTSGQDLPSILEECMARGFDRVDLSWHYRSKHESLISFSNAKYYKNLNTFPSVCESQLTGVQYRFVSKGVWAGQRNEEEALQVVSYVIDTAKSFEFQSELRGPKGKTVPSIGVVAFNESQQELIARLLRNSPDADFLYLKKPDDDSGSAGALQQEIRGRKPVAYFVKNLESVQGDEADVIVFSIGYGPNQPRSQLQGLTPQELKHCFPTGYGRLNENGGEKRLNVAITRGRVRMMVFSSIYSGEVNVTNDEKKGPAHFQEFLRAAEQSGERTLGDSAAVPERGLVQSVAKVLDELGYEYVAMVGASKCKIDLAVKDKYDTHRFLLGVECDGPMYRDQPMVMDRDVSRTVVMERGAHWTMYRVWSAEWYGSPVAARERLQRKLEELSDKSLERREMRWREICRAKDAEMCEIEDFSARDTERDLLAEVVDELDGEEEDAS